MLTGHGLAQGSQQLAARQLTAVAQPLRTIDRHRNALALEPILHRATKRICLCEMLAVRLLGRKRRQSAPLKRFSESRVTKNKWSTNRRRCPNKRLGVNAVFGYQYAAEKLESVRHKESGGVMTFWLLFAVHEVRGRFGCEAPFGSSVPSQLV